ALVGREAHRLRRRGEIVVLLRYGESPLAAFKDSTRCLTLKPIVVLEEQPALRGLEEDRGPSLAVSVLIWQSCRYFRLRRYQAEIQVAHDEADVADLIG